MQEDKLEENVTVLQVKDDRKLDQPGAHLGGQMVMNGTAVGGELAMEGVGEERSPASL